jgi:hypothetical protein
MMDVRDALNCVSVFLEGSELSGNKFPLNDVITTVITNVYLFNRSEWGWNKISISAVGKYEMSYIS